MCSESGSESALGSGWSSVVGMGESGLAMSSSMGQTVNMDLHWTSIHSTYSANIPRRLYPCTLIQAGMKNTQREQSGGKQIGYSRSKNALCGPRGHDYPAHGRQLYIHSLSFPEFGVLSRLQCDLIQMTRMKPLVLSMNRKN